jgi:hypothetical protein
VGATISKLAVKLQADTAGFKSGMASAKTSVSKFGQSASGAIGPLKGLIAPLAGAAAAALTVGAAIKGVSSAMSRLDEVTKKARSLDMATEDLMGLQHAAEQAGVSSDNMTKAMQKLQKGIGLALIDQAGPAHDALTQLGLDVNRIGQMSPEQQFLVIADALKNVTDPAQRAALAMDLFGKAGQDLTILTNQGSAAIQAQIDELRRLQGTLSETDTANIEAANDAWHKVGLAVEGVFNQVAAAWAPVSEELGSDMATMLGGFANFIGEHKEEITQTIDSIVNAVKNAVGMVVNTMTTIIDIFKSLGITNVETAAKVAAFVLGLTAAMKIFPLIVGGIEALIGVFKALTAAQVVQQALSGPAGWATLAVGIGVAATAVAGVGYAFDELTAEQEDSNAKLDEAVAQAEKLNEVGEQNVATQKKNTEELDKQDKKREAAVKRGQQLLEQNKTQAEKYADQLKEIDQLVTDGGLTAEQGATLRAKVETKIQSDVDKVVQAQEKARKDREKKLVDDWKKGAEDAAKNSTDTLVRAGSKEMFEQQAKAQFKKENPLVRFQKDSNKIQKDQLTVLKDIAKLQKDYRNPKEAGADATTPIEEVSLV